MRRGLVLGLVGCFGLSGCDGSGGGGAVDAAGADAVADAPSADAPLDALAPDALAIDASVPVVPSLAPLTLDPSFSDDGELLFDTGHPGALSSWGPRVEFCAVAVENTIERPVYDARYTFRTTPGAAEDVFATAPLGEPTICTAGALLADGSSVSAFLLGSGPTQLVRRDAAGVMGSAQAPPQAGEVRALVAFEGGRVAAVFDTAVWLLDATTLAPIAGFGVNGRLATPGTLRAAVRPHVSGARLDLVTTTAVLRVDVDTGALDPSFGTGGVAALSTDWTYGAVPLLDGGLLLIGVVGTGRQVSPTGAVRAVSLPPVSPTLSIDDGAGGAYLFEVADINATSMTVTRIAPSSADAWGTGGSQVIAPPLGCAIHPGPLCNVEWFRLRGAAWTSAGRLALLLENRGGMAISAFHTRAPQLVVLTR